MPFKYAGVLIKKSMPYSKVTFFSHMKTHQIFFDCISTQTERERDISFGVFMFATQLLYNIYESVNIDAI